MKPPSSGPTAAAIPAAAPTSAYACFCAAPSKLPWMSDCIAGRRRGLGGRRRLRHGLMIRAAHVARHRPLGVMAGIQGAGDAAVMTTAVAKSSAAAAGGMVLTTLAAGQFLMTLDSSVMNVSI